MSIDIFFIFPGLDMQPLAQGGFSGPPPPPTAHNTRPPPTLPLLPNIGGSPVQPRPLPPPGSCNHEFNLFELVDFAVETKILGIDE